MRCEVCGHKIHDEPILAVIEGARLTVCVECSKHGKVVFAEPAAPRQAMIAAKKPQAPISMVQRKPTSSNVQITQEVTEDYANEIRAAREKLGLTHEELRQKNK